MHSEMAFPSSVKGVAIAGLADLLGGIRYWRVWHLIGIRELRHRYARSKLGQLWLMLSNAAMILVLTFVFALLFNQPISQLMPFVGIGVIMWNYLSQILLECTLIFFGQAK